MDVTKYTHKTPAAAHEFGFSPNTLRAIAKRDPDFPQPLIVGRRIIRWNVEAIRSYFAAKREA